MKQWRMSAFPCFTESVCVSNHNNYEIVDPGDFVRGMKF